MPAGHYHKLASEAVERGDLDGAIVQNLRARLRSPAYAPALAQREMLLAAVARHEESARQELIAAERALVEAEGEWRRFAAGRRWIQAAAFLGGSLSAYFVATAIGCHPLWAALGGVLAFVLARSVMWPAARRVRARLVRAEEARLKARQELERQARRRALLDAKAG